MAANRIQRACFAGHRMRSRCDRQSQRPVPACDAKTGWLQRYSSKRQYGCSFEAVVSTLAEGGIAIRVVEVADTVSRYAAVPVVAGTISRELFLSNRVALHVCFGASFCNGIN